MRRFLQVAAVGFALGVLATLVWMAQSRAPAPDEALAAPVAGDPAAATVAPPEHLPSTKMMVVPIAVPEVDPEFLPSTKAAMPPDFLPSTKAAPLDLEFLPSTKADAGTGALLRELGTNPPEGGHPELERQQAVPQAAP